KGMAATMGFNKMAELTHSMENVLDKIRNKNLKASTDIVTVLFQCVDTLEKMLKSVSEGGGDDFDTSQIIAKLKGQDGAKADEKVVHDADAIKYNKYDIDVIKEAEDKLYNAYEINITLRKDCKLKAARAFLIFDSLQKCGEIVKSDPPAESIEKEEFKDRIMLVFVSQKKQDFVKKVIDGISEIDSFTVNEIDDKKISAGVMNETSTKQVVSDAGKKNKNVQNKTKKKIGQSVRVDLGKLDKLMNLVGELVIYRTRLEQIGRSNNIAELNETLEQFARITGDLQDIVMKVRMIPLEIVFGRLPRMVRDLSTELGKEINFVIKGQETELDRTVVDELGESIVHLLRNAVDHGIESREERIKAGKNPVGNVTVTAYQEGNKAVIKVEDDGHGLDVEKIKKKAVAKGIDINGMNDNDIRNLIFLEGFSTSDKVTDISGRGVGMDVVRTKVTSIGGSVDVKSEMGKGTSFIVYLPLTLSIIQALFVKVAGEIFAISFGFIEKIQPVSESDIKYANGKEIIIYRDELVRLIRLSSSLKLRDEKEKNGFIVIVKIGDKKAALMVDSIIGQREIAIKPLGKSLKDLKQYSGATITGDGRVMLILDVVSIITER
ncbi:MAG TPA: chemotaxis protein CheA, partial [Clostridiaceae bacterium]|nr:chemotaxis protein CheA [Clostridiaceae bacterium]